MDEDALLGCIDGVAHGLEIVQSLFPGWRFGPPDTVAAFGLHGRLYCGPFACVAPRDRPHWRVVLERFGITLDRDGRRIDEGVAANVLGGPLSACLHFLRGLAEDGAYSRGVEPGDIVTTGTVTRAFPVAAGQTWTSRISGLELPGLTLSFR